MAAVTMATGMVAATGISAATAMAISAGTTEVEGSQYPVRFREAKFAAIAPLRSATPRSGRATIATR
jgi:hypothetical protein